MCFDPNIFHGIYQTWRRRPLALHQVVVHWASSDGPRHLPLPVVMPLQALCKIFISHMVDTEQLEYKSLLRSKVHVRILIFTLGFYTFLGSYLFIEHLLDTGSKLITDHGSFSPENSQPEFWNLHHVEQGHGG